MPNAGVAHQQRRAQRPQTSTIDSRWRSLDHHLSTPTRIAAKDAPQRAPEPRCGNPRHTDVHRCFRRSGRCCFHRRRLRVSCCGPGAECRPSAVNHATLATELSIVECRLGSMTIPFGEPEPSDELLNKSMWSTRLRRWLDTRLRTLAADQRIQDARALRNEFVLD